MHFAELSIDWLNTPSNVNFFKLSGNFDIGLLKYPFISKFQYEMFPYLNLLV
jgi:hypothetical protein